MRPLIGITQGIEPRESGGWRTYIDKSYQDAVYRAGGMPVLLPVPDDLSTVAELAGRLDGLLLSGGEDIHPRYYGQDITCPMELSPDSRTDFEDELTGHALERNIPILAICLGIQALNVHLGGTLIQDLQGHKNKVVKLRHEVRVKNDSLLRNIAGTDSLTVNSTHHQAVDKPGGGLVVSGTAPDGVVEAVEYPSHPFVLGLQWHPEKMPDDPDSRKIFSAFVKACMA